MTLLVCDHSLNWEEGHFNNFQRLDINKLWRGFIGETEVILSKSRRI